MRGPMVYVCSCDFDPPLFHQVRQVQEARQRHKCCECLRYIAKGEGYQYETVSWHKGNFDTYHTCTQCVALLHWARISVPCFCYSYEHLQEDVWEMVEEVRHEVPGFFTEYARRILRAERETGHRYWHRRVRRRRTKP